MGFSDLRSLKRLWSNYQPQLQSSEGSMGQKDPFPSWLSDMAAKFMLAVDKRPQFCSILHLYGTARVSLRHGRWLPSEQLIQGSKVEAVESLVT